MNRSVAMIVAGAITTLAVIGGTMAISQSGALAGSTVVQKNGEIAVQVNTSDASPVVSVTAEPVVLEVEALPTALDIQVADDSSAGESATEAALRQRLEQAYKLLSDRDGMYQARLKEAYDKLKQAETDAAAAAVTVPSNDQPVASATAEYHDDDDDDINDDHGDDDHDDDDSDDDHDDEDDEDDDDDDDSDDQGDDD